VTKIVVSDRALLQWIARRCPFDLEATRATITGELQKHCPSGVRLKALSDRGFVLWLQQNGLDTTAHRLLLESATREAVESHKAHALIGDLVFSISRHVRRRGLDGIFLFDTAVLEGAIGRNLIPQTAAIEDAA
jgi:hypothetical protein